MNPPYDGSLHLKILAEAIQHLKDDKSICVNLSPARWLQDPLAKYKKRCDFKQFENSISKHISTLDIIYKSDACKIFIGAGINSDLGIYKITKNGGYDYLKNNANSIVDKVLNKMTESFADKVENNKLNGWRVRVNELQPLEAGDARNPVTQKWRHFIINPNTSTYVYKDGYTKDGKFWTELVQKGKYSKKIGDPLVLSIKFDSELEAANFEASCKTTFMNALKNIMQKDQHVPLFAFPFMGDYSREWTDEDFYQYFDITPEEQKIIEETMSQYK